MSWRECGGTDLPVSALHNGIVVVTPKGFSELAHVEFVKRDVMRLLNLRHAGMLKCRASDGEPTEFIPCGGNLWFEPIAGESAMSAVYDWLRRKSASGYRLFCLRCVLNVTTTRYTKDMLENAMFHLMLKQMFPLLQCCNYIDCSVRPSTGLDEEMVRAIRSLGVVAVDNCLLGIAPDAKDLGQHASGSDNYGLGFILKPNIRSRTHGPEELWKWAQYLVWMKMEQMKDILNGCAAEVYGPKPTRG